MMVSERHQTPSPLQRRTLFAVTAATIMALCAFLGLGAALSEDSDAINYGSESSPLTSFSFGSDGMTQAELGPYYVKVGSYVSIVGGSDEGDGYYADHVTGVTSGYGLTFSNGTADNVVSGYLGKVTGTISKAGTIGVSWTIDNDGISGVLESGTYTMTIIAVAEPTLVTSIAINTTLSSTWSITMGTTSSYRAICSPTNASDMTVTWSLSNSNAEISRTWNDTYNGVYRNGVDITGVTPGTVVLTATANDGSGISVTKTLTIKPYYYCLDFDSNGGDGEPDSICKEATNSTSTFKVTIPSTTPTRDGYTFLGWSTSSTATTATYSPGQTVTIDYDGLYLYAVWAEAKQYWYAYLYYSANGGSGTPSTDSAYIYAASASGSKTFTVKSGTPTRSGYEFQGWSTSSSASTASYSAGSTISVAYDDSKTLYAVWKPTYTCYLKYDANGGSGAPGQQEYTSTSTSSHTFTVASGEPTRTGYMFMGWATSSSGSASYHAGSTVAVSYNGTKTLYAVWQSAQLTITSSPSSLKTTVGGTWTYTPVTNISGCTVSVSGADWLSVSDGHITGSPTSAGTYDITVKVTKDGGYTAGTQTFTVTVYSAMGFVSTPAAAGIFAYVS